MTPLVGLVSLHCGLSPGPLSRMASLSPGAPNLTDPESTSVAGPCVLFTVATWPLGPPIHDEG
jgi:hypothetical protein